jgi:hypothetical protein
LAGSNGTNGATGPTGLQGNLGNTGPIGLQGDTGIPGNTGPTGPNEVTSSTTTNLTGYLKGNGATVGVEAIIANPYKFRAHRHGAWNTPAGAFGKVLCEVEDYDTGGNYDNATNYRFTAPVNGYYHFNGSVHAGGITILIVSLYVGGAEAYRGTDTRSASATTLGGQVSADIYLAQNSYVELWVYTNTAVAGSTDDIRVWFCGHLIGN